MDIYGIVEDGVVIERFESKEEWEARFRSAMKEGRATGFRKLRFNELTENEKLQSMKNKLEELDKFLEEMKGAGRTYYSHTNIKSDELSWLIGNTEKNFK